MTAARLQEIARTLVRNLRYWEGHPECSEDEEVRIVAAEFAAIRRETIEECAKICERRGMMGKGIDTEHGRAVAEQSRWFTRDIRSLMDSAEPPEKRA